SNPIAIPALNKAHSKAFIFKLPDRNYSQACLFRLINTKHSTTFQSQRAYYFTSEAMKHGFTSLADQQAHCPAAKKPFGELIVFHLRRQENASQACSRKKRKKARRS
ncbi:MAG: hypothetical protein ACK53L_19990, partial [Pirellulaceae bacterium]